MTTSSYSIIISIGDVAINYKYVDIETDGTFFLHELYYISDEDKWINKSVHWHG